MADDFKYDVFLSHSSKDKEARSPHRERLRADGLRVWFEDWEVKPAHHNRPPSEKIEEGLECARVLVLCMSEHTRLVPIGQSWRPALSVFVILLKKERRFIPLRFDETPIEAYQAQFIYLDWRMENRGQEYAKLLEACRPPEKQSTVKTAIASEQFAEKSIQIGGREKTLVYAFSNKGERVLANFSERA